MRILHITTFLQGGAGRVIVDLARTQRGSGHDVSVMTSRTGADGYGNYPEYLAALSAAGVTSDAVDSTFSRAAWANLAVVRALDRRYPAGQEPHVVHAHAAVPGLAALVFAGSRRARMAVLQTMHGWGVAKTAEQESADRDVMSLVDRVAVPSKHAAAQLVSLGVPLARLTVVPYGVSATDAKLTEHDDRLLRAMTQARAAGSLVLACVGTIGERKNQALLVDAVARLRGEPAVLAVFIGDGDIDGLRACIERAGVAARCHVHGYSAAARRIASEADALVLPSRSEGQPIAVLEAFADATLVLVSDIPELAELVDHGVTGFRFAPENAEDLARAIAHVASLSADARRILRGHARDRQIRRHSLTAMTQRYTDLYRDLLRGAAPAAARRPAAPAA